jgi:transposase
MRPKTYFSAPRQAIHKQYEALRAFFVEGMSAEEVATAFGYSLSAVYSLVRDFRKDIATKAFTDPFFIPRKAGRKPMDETGELHRRITSLRKKYLSVPDIKAILDAQGDRVSERYVYDIITKDGFARLPRRTRVAKNLAASSAAVQAPEALALSFDPENFSSANTLGILCLLPYIQNYGIDRLIESSAYPETTVISRLSSILSFVALKLSNVRRYTQDDVWCMDRGLGLFAGLNVLPKAAWFSSYSHRITRSMNLAFLRGLHQIWRKHGLLGDTANLDFTTIPYWGDASHLENNWSGKRHTALASMLAVLAQEPESGIITYGDTNIRHGNKSDVVLEFLDFYRSSGKQDLAYLVFDSKFTTYENLKRLDPEVKFITIRRRGKNIVEGLDALPSSAWKKVRVPAANGKGRTLRINDSRIFLRDYGQDLRQVAITGHGKIKPALIITNDFECAVKHIIRTYARRWLVEKNISEQIEFFHLNRLSSSVVIKVDFDLTMSILAHNILRLFALDLAGYEHQTSQTLYNKFLTNGGAVEIAPNQVTVKLNKKRTLPALLTAMEPFQGNKFRSWDDKVVAFVGDSRS